MVMAVVGTLVGHHIVSWEWILTGAIVGSTVGAAMAIFMPMTAMPQRIALSHSFGALAAVLVGVAHYHKEMASIGSGTMGALGFEVLFGSLTITGSLMAFGKLQGIVHGPPITYPHQNVSNMAIFFATVAMFVYLVYSPQSEVVFYAMLAIGLVIGVLIVLPIGGADMPVVISLLNSYAGLAASATGFVINNKVLIIAGALDGASGFFLSILMSRAMNRSFANVLFGAVGGSARRNPCPGRAAHRDPVHARGRHPDAGDLAIGHRGARLRHGGGPGPARHSGVGRVAHGSRHQGALCDSPGRRTHARSHERVAGRGPGPPTTNCWRWTRSTTIFRIRTW